jgi:phosphoribosylamine--glycine ligase
MTKRTFVFITDFGEITDLAFHLKYHEKQNVVMQIKDSKWKKIGDGLIEKIDDFHEYLGQGAIFVFDGANSGKVQDYLRGQGEAVFGGSLLGDELENNRDKGQDLFKKMGFNQPFYQNFSDLDKLLEFVKVHKDKHYVLKQGGDLPKSMNHISKFEKSVDMIEHLEKLKQEWNSTEYGKPDFQLMEKVEGVEIAASAWWNGNDWMRNADGKIVGWGNGEEKKEIAGGIGTTTGETHTTFFPMSEDDELFKDILLRPALANWLKKSGFRGVVDINGMYTKESFVGFEFTMRFGIPSTSYEMIEGLESSAADLLEAVAKGEQTPVRLKPGVGAVVVLSGKPYPVEATLPDEETSAGERLWLLKNGEPCLSDLWAPRFQHIHPYNVFFDEENQDYRIATESGYILTATGTGDSIKEARDKAIGELEDKIYLTDMKWRADGGDRLMLYEADVLAGKKLSPLL